MHGIGELRTKILITNTEQHLELTYYCFHFLAVPLKMRFVILMCQKQADIVSYKHAHFTYRHYIHLIMSCVCTVQNKTKGAFTLQTWLSLVRPCANTDLEASAESVDDDDEDGLFTSLSWAGTRVIGEVPEWNPSSEEQQAPLEDEVVEDEDAAPDGDPEEDLLASREVFRLEGEAVVVVVITRGAKGC